MCKGFAMHVIYYLYILKFNYKNIISDRNGSSSSSEETDYPHNDVAYANVLKSWNPVLSATGD